MTNRASNPAATNVSAMREYEQAIASEPSMSIRDARLLREKINNMSRQRASALPFENSRSEDDAWWLRIFIRSFPTGSERSALRSRCNSPAFDASVTQPRESAFL